MPLEFVSFEFHSNCKANLLNLDLNLNALFRVQQEQIGTRVHTIKKLQLKQYHRTKKL